jgi:hypothetical protein
VILLTIKSPEKALSLSEAVAPMNSSFSVKSANGKMDFHQESSKWKKSTSFLPKNSPITKSKKSTLMKVIHKTLKRTEMEHT